MAAWRGERADDKFVPSGRKGSIAQFRFVDRQFSIAAQSLRPRLFLGGVGARKSLDLFLPFGVFC